MTYKDILEEALKEGNNILENPGDQLLDAGIVAAVDQLITGIDKNKSLVSAFTTSVVKKLHDPQQDIRLPRDDFPGGYSGRSLDTKVITPFFKQHFPRYANKESSVVLNL